MRTSRSSRIWLPAAAAALLAAAGLGHADQITYGGFSYNNVRILGFEDGVVRFETARGRQREVSLAEVQGLKLDEYPALAEADAAMSEANYAEAAEKLRGLLERVEKKYLKILVTGKLIGALDAQGKLAPAVDRYVDLVALTDGPFAEAAMPRSAPADADQAETLADKLTERAGGIADAGQRELLNKLAERIKSGESGGDGGGVALVQGEKQAKADPVQKLLDQGKLDEALAEIEKRLGSGAGTTSKLLYQRGVALARKGRNKDAALSLMRVVIHFNPRATPSYVPALIEAGEVMKTLGKPDHARRLWSEAQDRGEPAQRERAKKLLDGLDQ